MNIMKQYDKYSVRIDDKGILYFYRLDNCRGTKHTTKTSGVELQLFVSATL